MEARNSTPNVLQNNFDRAISLKDYTVEELKVFLRALGEPTLGNKGQLFVRYKKAMAENEEKEKAGIPVYNYKGKSIKYLKAKLKEFDLPISGPKKLLLARLDAYHNEYDPPRMERKPTRVSSTDIYDYRLLSDMKLPNIKKMAKHYGLKVGGRKLEVANRITAHVIKQGFDLDSALPGDGMPISKKQQDLITKIETEQAMIQKLQDQLPRAKPDRKIYLTNTIEKLLKRVDKMLAKLE